jgi:hypothetical protein
LPESTQNSSFPYMNLSRRLNLPYEKVLAYVAMLDGIRDVSVSNREWGLAASALLGEPDASKIMAVWRQEKIRQGRIAG